MCISMEKWPDVFSDLIEHVKDSIKDDSFGNAVLSGVKIENPQSHLYPDPTIPKPEVMK